MSLREYSTFFRQFRQRYETTGAIAPSSRFLASAITRPLRQRPADRPVRILEIGPGTGAFTRTIVRHVRNGDTFDLVELNDVFVGELNQQFESDPQWQTAAGQSTVHNVPLQEFGGDEPYDFVISGLPLNNFPADLVEQIFEEYFRLLAPGGTLSYFEYMFIRPIRRRVTGAEDRQRLTRIDEIMGRHLAAHGFRRDWVFVNMPPAWAQHLRVESSESPVERRES